MSDPLRNPSEADPGFDYDKLTPEEKRTYDAAMKAAKDDFEPDKETARVMGVDESIARYKIEIMFIIGDWIRGGAAYCPNCEATIASDFLTCQRGGKVTTKALANSVAKIFRQLDHSADIYCKYNREDIHVKILEEKVGAEKARELRGLFIYPLKNILKDTAAGASLESRFEAFFKA
jgi:hypothetical protein